MKSSFVLTLQHHHIGKQDPIAMDFKTWNMFWRLCFGVLATLIITGNILIIWIFFKLRRRKRSSFLLIGLGVADLLVGGLAIPLLIATYESASITVWRVFDLVDMFTSTSSIYALAVISVERMFAIGWPLRHRTANFRVYICAISIPWIIAAIFTVLTDAYLNFIIRDRVIYLLVLFPVTPLLVMCVAYYVIWRKQKSPICNHKKCHQRGQISKHIIFDYRSFCFHLTSIPDSEPVGIFANNCKLFSSANSKTHRHQGFTI